MVSASSEDWHGVVFRASSTPMGVNRPRLQVACPNVPVSLREPKYAVASLSPRSRVGAFPSASETGVPASASKSLREITAFARSRRPAGSARTRNNLLFHAAPVCGSMAVDCRPISAGFPIRPANEAGAPPQGPVPSSVAAPFVSAGRCFSSRNT